jgi:hypothetical protein
MLDKVTKCQDDDIDSNDTENVELESKVFVAWLYFINDGTTPTSKDSSD